MEKLYNDKDYSDKAVQANNEKKALYIYVHDIDCDTEVLEWNEEEKQEERQVTDEEGNSVYDEKGNPVTEMTTVIVAIPKMVEEVIEVPVYDEYGNLVYDKEGNPVTENKTIEVQAHHTETRQKTVAELLIAEPGYYICYRENYTDGTLNPNYEEEKERRERERILKLSMTKLDFVNYMESFGITYDYIKGLLAQSEQAQKEWELCERIYRFNSILNAMALTAGITSEQLDYIFKKANGEDVEPVV